MSIKLYLHEMFESRLEDIGGKEKYAKRYKESQKKVNVLRKQVIELLPDEHKKIVDLLLEQETDSEGILQTIIYRQAFKDGIAAAKELKQ